MRNLLKKVKYTPQQKQKKKKNFYLLENITNMASDKVVSIGLQKKKILYGGVAARGERKKKKN